jgi:branched-chain amino acid transport system substrate-binding protein
MKLELAPTTLLALAALALAGPVAAQEQVIKIGHSGPLSGPNAYAGKDNENGVRLATEDLNAKKIVSVAQKMVDSNIKYVMGPYCSGVAIPASRIYDSGDVVLSTVGTNPKVTQGGFKHLFRIIASDNQIGSSMAVYAAQVLKVKKVGVIDDRTAFGQGVADEFVKEATKQGLTIVGKEFTTDKATDFSAILTNLKGKQPEALFYGGYAPQAAPMAQQMKRLAFNAKLLGGDTLCSPEMGKIGGDAVNDTVFCAQAGAMAKEGSPAAAFKAKYKARFKQDPDAYAAAYYDQVMLIGDAMQKAGSTDSLKVSEQMHKASYQGVAATYAYDAMGNMQKAPVTVSTFKNATLSPLASY